MRSFGRFLWRICQRLFMSLGLVAVLALAWAFANPSWRPLLLDFIYRSWSTFLQAESSSTIGFFSNLSFPIFSVVITLAIVFLHHGKAAMLELKRDSIIAIRVTAIVATLIYGPVLLYKCLETVYADHASVVASANNSKANVETRDQTIARLETENSRLKSENDSLKNSRKTLPTLPRPPASPAPTPGSPESPPVLLSMKIVSQERYASTNTALPFALKVVVQTNIVVNPVSLLFTCNGEVGDMAFEFSGGDAMALMNDRSGVLNDKRTFLISFESHPFTPEKPMLIYLHSKEAIRVTSFSQAGH